MFVVACSEPAGDQWAMDSEPGEETDDGDAATAGDPNLSDQACAAAGGAFGIVATHQLPLEDVPRKPNERLQAPGLAVGPAGLVASVSALDEADDLTLRGYRMRLSFDGELEAPPEPIDGSWAGGRWWPGQSMVLVTHCTDDVPGWTFIDQAGHAVGPAAHPEQESGCFAPPSASWLSDTEALIGWFDPEVGCDDGARCVRVTRASPEGHNAVNELFYAGTLSGRPSVSIATGPNSALVAMLRVGTANELVAQLIDLEGNPTAPTFVEIPSASSEPMDETVRMQARVVPDSEDGFYVYLGGWGFSMGRMRFDPSGSVLEPLEELPLIIDPVVSSVYNSGFDGVHPRPGGWVVVGDAVSGGSVRTMFSALSPEGNFVGHVVLPSRFSTVTATDGNRLFALGAGISANVYELGCRIP